MLITCCVYFETCIILKFIIRCSILLEKLCVLRYSVIFCRAKHITNFAACRGEEALTSDGQFGAPLFCIPARLAQFQIIFEYLWSDWCSDRCDSDDFLYSSDYVQSQRICWISRHFNFVRNRDLGRWYIIVLL